MQKRQKVSTGSENLKKLVISSNVWKFGATKANGENAADIVAKWPSGTVWAVRVQKTLKDREEFNPDIPRATAVIAIRTGDDTEFYSARTGRRLTMPGVRARQKARYRSDDDDSFAHQRTKH